MNIKIDLKEVINIQKIECYNRRLALELEAIGPFVEPLSKEAKEDFRTKIGERTFGQGEDAHSKYDTKSPTNITDIFADPEKKTFLTNALTSFLDFLKHK